MQDALLDKMDSISELEIIRQKIESLPKFNQVEILRILNKDTTVTLNENKYGTFINLTELPNDTVENLKKYINYVNTQEYHLNYLEKQKEDFKNTYFAKDNKDILVKNKYA
jgi:Pyruvate/2-oxoacid:ferredoxin oxidoreductase gamma subunit